VVLMPSGDGKDGDSRSGNGQPEGVSLDPAAVVPATPEGLPFQCPRCHGTGFKHMKRGQKRRIGCPYCAGIGWIKYKGTAYERWRGSKKVRR
jgi:hypothetical protein